MFKKNYIGFYIRTYPYEFNGSKIGFIVYHKYYFLGCLFFDRVSICPDIDMLIEVKFLLGIK